MATVIKVKNESLRSDLRAFEKIKSFLPYKLCDELNSVQRALSVDRESIEEIRIRSGRKTYVTVGNGRGKRNMALSAILDSAEIAKTLERMCDGSLYAYSESIVKGCISLGEGIRVGVCGRASTEREKILGVYDISAMNIRLPCEEVFVERELTEHIRRTLRGGEGVLIYSPPAEGKTTLLRSLCLALSRGRDGMRVALIDTKEEFGSYFGREELSLDILSGYPKAEGIRIATAFMNPQVIICDEIGSEDEAVAIAQAQNCGVPLVASAHAATAEALLRRDGMRRLHKLCVFGSYVGIRIGNDRNFEYRIQHREELTS